MLSSFKCSFDYGWLNADRQGYNHSIDVFDSEEVIEGVAGCGRRVIICLDRLGRAFGKLVGGCFGARVDGFEGEERGCLDSWEMLWVEEILLVSCTAITMPRGE